MHVKETKTMPKKKEIAKGTLNTSWCSKPAGFGNREGIRFPPTCLAEVATVADRLHPVAVFFGEKEMTLGT